MKLKIDRLLLLLFIFQSASSANCFESKLPQYLAQDSYADWLTILTVETTPTYLLLGGSSKNTYERERATDWGTIANYQIDQGVYRWHLALQGSVAVEALAIDTAASVAPTYLLAQSSYSDYESVGYTLLNPELGTLLSKTSKLDTDGTNV